MASLDHAIATQIHNIEMRTGKSIACWKDAIAASGKQKHGEIRSWLKDVACLGHGDANLLASVATAVEQDCNPLDTIYAGRKAHLRAVQDAVLAAVTPWGDFEIAPKKAYVALRRKKQFAMIGPKNTSVAELGINLKDALVSDRVIAQKPGGMCRYAVILATPADLDADIIAILRRAYDAAG